jgi:hypothetical protein
VIVGAMAALTGFAVTVTVLVVQMATGGIGGRTEPPGQRTMSFP